MSLGLRRMTGEHLQGPPCNQLNLCCCCCDCRLGWLLFLHLLLLLLLLILLLRALCLLQLLLLSLSSVAVIAAVSVIALRVIAVVAGSCCDYDNYVNVGIRTNTSIPVFSAVIDNIRLLHTTLHVLCRTTSNGRGSGEPHRKSCNFAA